MAHAAPSPRTARRRPVAAGLLLGVGLGGFVDGIVFHQILQWHHLLSAEGSFPVSTIAGLEANTLADGLFHAFAWIAVVAGVFLLWRVQAAGVVVPGRTLLGLVLAGWGAFNVAEGVVNHHVLGIHHVRAAGDAQLAFDLAFLALGGALLAAGYLLARAGGRPARHRATQARRAA